MQRTDPKTTWEDRHDAAPSHASVRKDPEKLLSGLATPGLFESFPAPLLIVDGDDQVAALNKEASVLIGEPAQRVIGRKVLQYIHLDEGGDTWERARSTRRGLRDIAGEVRAPAAHVPVRLNMNAVDEDEPRTLLVMLRSASRDEAVIRSLREVAGRAAHTAAGLANMGEETTRKAERIRTVMQGIADGTQVQARKVEETVEVIKDLAKNIDQISSHAVSVSGRIQAQAVTAREGTHVANKAFDRLTAIVEGVETTARSVLDLAAHVEQVEKILDFVDEVARETNLVSLNAAIEAARAGESGRAFTAVAEEVKRLAAHTRESLTDTAKLIEAAKSEAATVQRDADARVREVTASAEHIREALARFENVANDILESSDMIGDISRATMDQKRSAGAIVAAIDEVAGVAEDATKGTEDAHIMADEVTQSMQALTQASHELTSIAESLRSTLERYFEAKEDDHRKSDAEREQTGGDEATAT